MQAAPVNRCSHHSLRAQVFVRKPPRREITQGKITQGSLCWCTNLSRDPKRWLLLRDVFSSSKEGWE